MYEIIVPHNELFQYWEDDNVLWHVKDPDHTHPKYDTNSDIFKDSLWGWDLNIPNCIHHSPFLPSILASVGFWLINNNPKTIQAFARWCVECAEERIKVIGDKNYIFAYRSHGDKLEITYFLHPKTTNRPICWIG